MEKIKKFEEYINEQSIDKKSEFMTIGSTEEIFEMATIGSYMKNKKDIVLCNEKSGYKVFVNGGEGDCPHFHILDNLTKGNDFHTRLQILKPEYKSEGGQTNSVLNHSQIKDLIKFLQMKNDEIPDKTNWQLIILMWNMNNSTHKILNQMIEIPDYTKLQ